MEIVAFVVVAGLIGWWFYRNIDGKKSLDNSQNSALFGAERFSRENVPVETVKTVTPAEVNPEPVKSAEVKPEPEAVVAKPTPKAKKPPAMKKGTAPKVVAKTRKTKTVKK